MTPQEKQEFDELKKIVESLVRVENVPFIESIKRRGAVTGGVKSGTTLSASTITTTINEAGVAVKNVAKVPDGKLTVTLSDGTTKYIPIYNS